MQDLIIQPFKMWWIVSFLKRRVNHHNLINLVISFLLVLRIFMNSSQGVHSTRRKRNRRETWKNRKWKLELNWKMRREWVNHCVCSADMDVMWFLCYLGHVAFRTRLPKGRTLTECWVDCLPAKRAAWLSPLQGSGWSDFLGVSIFIPGRSNCRKFGT